MENEYGKQRTLFYFGGVVDPGILEENEYLLPWVNEHQLNMIKGLMREGFDTATSFSPLPFAPYPHGKKLIVEHKKSTYGDNIKIINVSYINIPIVKQMSIAVMNSVNVFREARKEKPTILLVYNPRFHHAVVAIFFSRILRVPFLVVVADFEHHKWVNIRKQPVRFIETLVSEYIMKRSDGMFCYSKWTAEDVGYKGPWLKMEGAINERLLTEAPYSFSEARNIMFTGALNEVGGIELLIDAFGLLEGNEYRLWITGKGANKKKVLEAESKDKRIQYFGFLEYDDFNDLLSKATVLVNPRLSRFPENRYNFPEKLLNYLASGRPVITTATGDVGDEYSDKAFILEEETPQALADLIREVCSMPQEELKDKCEGVKQYMLENKTWKFQCSRMYEFIMENLEGRGL